jgi:antibiotic biosynthesis monooxygenase (ABM) superfamily enzyme
VIERHVTFEVIPGKEQAFEDLFKSSYSTAMSKQRGFASVDLVRELDAPARYQMVIRFDTLENAAAWRDSADHKALSPVIHALYSASTVVAYSVVATVTA